MANEIEKAITDAAQKIRVAMGRVEKEMQKTREVLEGRLPVMVQLRAEDLTQYQADTVKALECCTQGGGCKECPMVEDDKCGTDLMIRALMTIKQLQEQLRAKPEPRAEERFELTEEERRAIAATKICDHMVDCNRCPFSVYGDCGKRKRKGVLKLLRRLLAEKGVDIDDL